MRTIIKRQAYLWVLVCIIGLPRLLWGQTQNPYWVFPPNYVNISAGTVSSLIQPSGYFSLSKSNIVNAANGIFGPSGTLDFYIGGNTNLGYEGYGGVVDVDRNGDNDDDTGGEGVEGVGANLNEIPVIPVPGTCNSYYILGNNITGGGCSCDVYPIFRQLVYDYSTYDISLNFDGFPLNTNSEGSYTFTLCGGCTGYAVSTIQVVDGAPQSYLYVVGQTQTPTPGCSTQASITQFAVTAPNAEGCFEGLPNSCGIAQLSNTTFSGVSFCNQELELSNDGTLLAWGNTNTSTRYIYTYNLTTNTLCSLSVSTSANVLGIEFSPSANRLFYSLAGSGIYYVPLSNNGSITGSASLVSGSGSLGVGYSQIEYAYDGNMYASDGTYLYNWNPNASSPSISTPICTVANVSGGGGPYHQHTLIDQIDGQNYSNLFLAHGSCTPSQSFGNTNALPHITKSSGYITTVSSTSQYVEVTAANPVTFTAANYVQLNPGFFTDATAVFEADIAPCAVADQNPDCDYSRLGVNVPKKAIPEKSQITIIPNPNSGTFRLKLTIPSKSINAIEIYDVMGVKVKTIQPSSLLLLDTFSGASENELSIIDMSGSPTGMYFVNVNAGGNVYTQKFIISQ